MHDDEWRNKMLYKGEELFRIAICDDEEHSRRMLRDILCENEKRQGDFLISMFSTGEALLNTNLGNYSMLILDMVLPGENGREVAKCFRSKNKNCMILCCSDKTAPIPEDFRFMPFRYMRKDREKQMRNDFQDAIDEMYRRRSKPQIKVTVGKVNKMIPVDDIVRIEIIKNGSMIYHYNKFHELEETKVKERLKELYSQLSFYGFEYAHSSYLVNCHYIDRWSRKELVLRDGTILGISRAREKTFQKACAKYIV